MLVEALLALVTWVAVTQVLRWRQAQRMAAMKNDRQLADYLSVQLHPFIWRKALEYALLKTYAVPSISKLLDQSHKFAINAVKRYDDTDLILKEILCNDFESERSKVAMARLNEIHGSFPIANRDYLYVLTNFVVDPVLFLEKYGCQQLTPRQLEAHVNVWLAVANKMGIKDVPQDYPSLRKYHDEFEAQYMKYAPSHAAVVAPLLDMMFGPVPKPVFSVLVKAISGLCEPHVRAALGFPSVPGWLPLLLGGILKARAFLVYWLIPPGMFTDHRLSDKPDADGRYHVAFNYYGCTYPKGYRIAELGTPKGCPIPRMASKAA